MNKNSLKCKTMFAVLIQNFSRLVYSAREEQVCMYLLRVMTSRGDASNVRRRFRMLSPHLSQLKGNVMLRPVASHQERRKANRCDDNTKPNHALLNTKLARWNCARSCPSLQLKIFKFLVESIRNDVVQKAGHMTTSSSWTCDVLRAEANIGSE